MKIPLRRALSAGLILAGIPVLAQTPAAQTTPAPAPAENAAPAEIVPVKPPATPAPGQKTVEVPDRREPLSPGTPATPDRKGTGEQSLVDELSEADVDQALSALKERYVAPSVLSALELKRATL